MKRQKAGGFGRRIGAVALSLVAGLTVLAGCGEGSSYHVQNENNEATGLEITSGQGKFAVATQAILNKFPDMDINVRYYVGANTTQYLKQELIHGNGGDIFIYSTKLEDEVAKEYLMDLSGQPFMSNIDSSMLAAMDVDGKIYQISGAVNARMIVYNQTLFDENGWKVPSNYEELRDVCRQIHEEQPDITPLAMGYATDALPFFNLAGLAQAGFLGTVDGVQWQKDYLAGKASIREGFEDSLVQFSELIDAGAFTYDGYETLWNATPQAFTNRQCAMGFVQGGFASYQTMLEGTAKPGDTLGSSELGDYAGDTYGVLPYFGKDKGSEGLSLVLNTTYGINKKLLESGNEQKLKDALKVIEYLTTEEGQLAMKTDDSQILVSKNSTENAPEYVQNLWNLNANGSKAIALYSGYEDVYMDCGRILIDAIKSGSSEGMIDKFVETGDRLHKQAIEGGKSDTMYGDIAEDLDTNQTAQLMMDMVQAQGLSDLTLATHTAADSLSQSLTMAGFCGNLYKGAINDDIANACMGSLKTTIVTVPLTGAEIKDILNTGFKVTGTDDIEVALPYGWSGLDASFNKDGSVTDLKLGKKALEDDSVYTAAMPLDDYTAEFADSHEITDTGIQISSLIKPYLEANKGLNPPKVSRPTDYQPGRPKAQTE